MVTIWSEGSLVFNHQINLSMAAHKVASATLSLRNLELAHVATLRPTRPSASCQSSLETIHLPILRLSQKMISLMACFRCLIVALFHVMLISRQRSSVTVRHFLSIEPLFTIRRLRDLLSSQKPFHRPNPLGRSPWHSLCRSHRSIPHSWHKWAVALTSMSILTGLAANRMIPKPH